MEGGHADLGIVVVGRDEEHGELVLVALSKVVGDFDVLGREVLRRFEELVFWERCALLAFGALAAKEVGILELCLADAELECNVSGVAMK